MLKYAGAPADTLTVGLTTAPPYTGMVARSDVPATVLIFGAAVRKGDRRRSYAEAGGIVREVNGIEFQLLRPTFRSPVTFPTLPLKVAITVSVSLL